MDLLKLQQYKLLVDEYYRIAVTVDVTVETERQVEILQQLQPMFDKVNVDGIADFEHWLMLEISRHLNKN